jgi:hypothetical protein
LVRRYAASVSETADHLKPNNFEINNGPHAGPFSLESKMLPSRIPLPWAEIGRVAVRATRSPSTVRRYLLGLPVESTTAASIASALVALGHAHLVRVV